MSLPAIAYGHMFFHFNPSAPEFIPGQPWTGWTCGHDNEEDLKRNGFWRGTHLGETVLAPQADQLIDFGHGDRVAEEMVESVEGTRRSGDTAADDVPNTTGIASGARRRFKLDVIKGLSGEVLCSFDCDCLWATAVIKEQISQIIGIEIHEQRLLSSSATSNGVTVLRDDEVISKTLTSSERSTGASIRLVQLPPRWAEALRSVSTDGKALATVDEDLRADWDIAVAAVLHRAKALKHASQQLRHDRQFLLHVVQENPLVVKYAPEEIIKDRDFVLAAVKRNGAALKYVMEGFRMDREVVIAAVKADGGALKYVENELNNDREVVLAAVLNDGSSLRYADPALRYDREFVIAAIRSNETSLKYAAPELRSDREFLLAVLLGGASASICCQNLMNGDMGHSDVKNAETIAEEFRHVGEKRGQALKYVAEELRHEREFVLILVERWGQALKYAPEELKADPDFVLVAARRNLTALKYAASKLWHDRSFVLTVVQWHGAALKYASEELRCDVEIVLLAALVDASALKYSGRKLQQDEDFLKKAECLNSSVARFVQELRRNRSRRFNGSTKHDHLLVRTDRATPWRCDGCGMRSKTTPGLVRYECASGCDFDLCGSCCREEYIVPAEQSLTADKAEKSCRDLCGSCCREECIGPAE